MVLRGLAGLLIGIAYGAVIWSVMSVVTGIGLDREHPGPLIPNAIDWARFVAMMAGLVTGVCASLLGLGVGLFGVRKTRAAGIGFSFGLAILILLSIDSLSNVENASARVWMTLLLNLIILPIGLSLIGVATSVVAGKMKPYDI